MWLAFLKSFKGCSGLNVKGKEENFEPILLQWEDRMAKSLFFLPITATQPAAERTEVTAEHCNYITPHFLWMLQRFHSYAQADGCDKNAIKQPTGQLFAIFLSFSMKAVLQYEYENISCQLQIYSFLFNIFEFSSVWHACVFLINTYPLFVLFTGRTVHFLSFLCFIIGLWRVTIVSISK